jgi:hypothetical protein
VLSNVLSCVGDGPVSWLTVLHGVLGDVPVGSAAECCICFFYYFYGFLDVVSRVLAVHIQGFHFLLDYRTPPPPYPLFSLPFISLIPNLSP